MNKEFLKKWIIPPGWIEVLNQLPLPFISRTTQGIMQFKDRHAGERCFILATGPSISKMNLLPLRHEKCIAVSLFGYHPDIADIRPMYHVAAPLHPPIDEKKGLQYLSMFKERYTWGKVICFLGISNYVHSFDNLLSNHPDMRPEEYYYIDYQHSAPLTEHNINSDSSWNPGKRPFCPFTVAQQAIMMAAFMGFTDIYLLGCDYNYMRDLDGRHNQHFYDDSKTMEGRENFMKIKNPLEHFFESSAILWKQYRLIYEFLNKKGISVYNCSPDSSLDMFPKIDFCSLVGK